jgi:hypothetical protein
MTGAVVAKFAAFPPFPVFFFDFFAAFTAKIRFAKHRFVNLPPQTNFTSAAIINPKTPFQSTKLTLLRIKDWRATF